MNVGNTTDLGPREKRKSVPKKDVKKKDKKVTGHDAQGCIRATGVNLCDCLDIDCPGCHYPCPRCDSPKCGHECRVNRKYVIDKVETEGLDLVVHNEYANAPPTKK